MHDSKQFDTLYVPEYGMTVLHEPCRAARLGHDYVMLAGLSKFARPLCNHCAISYTWQVELLAYIEDAHSGHRHPLCSPATTLLYRAGWLSSSGHSHQQAMGIAVYTNGHRKCNVSTTRG